MPKVTIYSGPNCPYCMRAKQLLQKKGVRFEEINVRESEEKLIEMKLRSGGKQTIPQIFIGDRHIGGSDELYALDAKGGLDPLLK